MAPPSTSTAQLDLFGDVLRKYASAPEVGLSNSDLYASLCADKALPRDAFEARVPIGKAGEMHSPLKRKVRWYQQTLKAMGVLERVPGQRGQWKITSAGKEELTRTHPKVALVAFSTELGVAIWGMNERVLPHLDTPIALCITSPPFPLRQPRAYGNPSAREYCDFICRALEPVVKNLLPGGSIVLNVSNDIFEEGSPARSTYLERLVIALEDRLGLALMDRAVWYNPSKPPNPTIWACRRGVQMAVAYEPLLWFCNDPLNVRANNRKVLQPHSERHKKLIAGGGEQRVATYGDGAYRIREGSYGNATPGRLPRNVLMVGSNCKDHRRYRADAERLGLPAHAAPMPKRLYDFFIDFLTEPGDFCVDLFGGRATMGVSAEERQRRWLVVEWVMEYLRAAAERFQRFPGYQLNLN